MDRFQDYFLHIKNNLAPPIAKAPVPFYIIQDNKAVRGHSGVFLRVGLKFFLLTASHMWRAINRHGMPVFAGWPEKDNHPIQLAGTDFHLAEEETYDVGVATLSTD